MTTLLLIGNGAREHALAEALCRSARRPRLAAYMKANNPGIKKLAAAFTLGSYADTGAMAAFARSQGASLAIIGPEEPLYHGAADALLQEGIFCVGPPRLLAQLETSKSFTRNLLSKYGIPGAIPYGVFTEIKGIEAFLASLPEVVIKPDGLTGGKGVLVQGEHFHGAKEALALSADIIARLGKVVIEEKIEGQEFSLQCFTDGKRVLPMPLVQDHKRRFDGDSGPNTGGMGSYSLADHSLPFLLQEDVDRALAITEAVAAALLKETGKPYRGIMYGGFMATGSGVRLLEYNARFGDPEAMNVLPLLADDFLELCEAVASGSLDGVHLTWDKQATVCKYLVPKDYGLPPEAHPSPVKPEERRLTVGDPGPARLYYSSVDQRDDGLYLTGSRAIGVVGMDRDLQKAEQCAEAAAQAVMGWLDHRKDIGTSGLIEKRVRHMETLRGKYQ